jgi:copper(I)-binding protein
MRLKFVSRASLALVASLAFAAPLAAGAAGPGQPALTEFMVGSLHIWGPWMRATPKGAAVAGGYVTIMNMGSEPERLIGASSEIAGSVEIHQMSMANGVMTMRPVDTPLEIKPGETLNLAPGGYHLMFMKPKTGAKEGQKVKATLVFEKAGKVEVEFAVGGVGAGGPGAGGQMAPAHKM